MKTGHHLPKPSIKERVLVCKATSKTFNKMERTNIRNCRNEKDITTTILKASLILKNIK